MRSFEDSTGRKWTVAINVDAVKRVKALLGVDLLEAVEGSLLERLIGDPVLLCDILFVVCKPQADAAGVTDEQFGQAMAGDAIDAATGAFLEALVDFFPPSRRRVLRLALEKVRKLEGMALDAAAEVLASDKLERVMAEQLETLRSPIAMKRDWSPLDPAAAVEQALAEQPNAGG